MLYHHYYHHYVIIIIIIVTLCLFGNCFRYFFQNSSEYLIRNRPMQDKAKNSICATLAPVCHWNECLLLRYAYRLRSIPGGGESGSIFRSVRVPGIYPHHKSVLPPFNTLGAPQNAIVVIQCRSTCPVGARSQCVAVIQARDRANMDVIASVFRFIQRCQTVSIFVFHGFFVFILPRHAVQAR